MQILELSIGGIGVFLFAQAGLLIWHLSRMNTTLMYIRNDFERAILDFDKKEVKRDTELNALWKRIDEHSVDINYLKMRVTGSITE